MDHLKNEVYDHDFKPSQKLMADQQEMYTDGWIKDGGDQNSYGSTNATDDDKATSAFKNINGCFIISLLLTVSIGTIQFGYMLVSWNVVSTAYGKRHMLDDDEQTTQVMIVQTLSIAGVAAGALFSGPIAAIGRWKCLLLANVVLTIGVLLTLVDDFVVLCIGRIIYGLSVGAFNVFCPKFISETAPIEIKGPAGALTQTCITFGQLVVFTIGLGMGDIDSKDADSFEVQNYWLVVFAIPLAIALAQVLLLIFVFPYDTPTFLKQRGEEYRLKELMLKIYKEEEVVDERISQIVVDDNSKEDGSKELGYKAVCCSPKYRRATLVGCFLSIFQQLTGVNAIFFYSNMIFKGLSLQPSIITLLLGIFNVSSVLIGLVLLAYFGRRQLMVNMHILMTVMLTLLGLYALDKNGIGMIVCVLMFITFFEFSSGPIVWSYNSEIMQDKALTIHVFLNWFTGLAISFSVPLLLKHYDIGQLFLVFAIFTAFGTAFIYLFMKETRGKTQAEIDEMFDDSNYEEYTQLE